MRYADAFAAWPTLSAMSKDLNVDYGKVKMWKQRDSIPAEYWDELIRAAGRRGVIIDARDLCRAAAA